MPVNGLLSPAVHSHISQLPRTIVTRWKPPCPSAFRGIQTVRKCIIHFTRGAHASPRGWVPLQCLLVACMQNKSMLTRNFSSSIDRRSTHFRVERALSPIFVLVPFQGDPSVNRRQGQPSTTLPPRGP